MDTSPVPSNARVPRRRARSANKTERREWIIDQLLGAMRSDEIFKTLDYRRKSEAYIKQYMHHLLKKVLVEVFDRLDARQPEPGAQAKAMLRSDKLKRKANAALFWEGDVKTTINHIRFLGAQHRPDFKVVLEGLRIAVEVKRGETGASVREGIGQSLVYASSGDFDFVVYLFIDCSKDKKILEAIVEPHEVAFIKLIWNQFNVRFAVV